MRFLFVDRIVELSPNEWVRGMKHITRDDPFLVADGDGRLCFIPSLIGETLGQLAAWSVMFQNDFSARPVAGIVACARLHRPAYVGETLLLESCIDEVDERSVHYHSLARVGDEPIFSIEGALGPMLPMHEFINTDEVKKQFREIYSPGDWFDLSSKPLATDSSVLSSGNSPIVAPMLFDKILFSVPGESIVAEKRITRAAPYFPDHFPNKPVLPLTVLLECKLNLAYEFIARSGYSSDYQVHEFRKIKMSEFVQPGDVIVCHVKVKQQTENELVLSYRSEVDGKRVCVVDVVLLSKGK